MTPTLRRRVFLVAAAVAGGLLLWGLTGLPDYGVYPGPYGDVLNAVAVGERKATNVVAAVTFDYRGVDTMGEEYILFAAVIGVAILLRAQRDEREEAPDVALSQITVGAVALPLMIVLALAKVRALAGSGKDDRE